MDVDLTWLYGFDLNDPDCGIDWLRVEATCGALGLDLLSVREGRIEVLRPDGIAGVVEVALFSGARVWLGPTIERCSYPPERGYELPEAPQGGRTPTIEAVDAALTQIARWRPGSFGGLWVDKAC